MKRRLPKELFAAALAYARSGVAIFPVRPDAKEPLTRRGHKDATNDVRQIQKWWAKWPTANIGLATGAPSKVVVLDVDVKGGVDGEATLRSLIDRFGELPPTLQARTPSGGRHVFFLAPPSVRVACSVGKLGPGLDIRGDGGYVLLAPSVVDGRAYEWLS